MWTSQTLQQIKKERKYMPASKQNQAGNENTETQWKSLYGVGGAAALIAGVLFRRNLGVEISLFSKYPPPDTVIGWFTLLQNNRFLGIFYLNFFDVIDYVLVGLMFLALYTALKHVNKSYMAIAAVLSFVGIAAYIASNTALSMSSLSDQYAAATTDAQRDMILAAGQAMLAINDCSNPGTHPSTAVYMSLLLIAIAGMITSVVMLRSDTFNRATPYLGILASTFDLAYCIGFVFVPSMDVDLVAVFTIPAAGLLLMIWHILIGRSLLQIATRAG
jgi:hypothetical protein